MVIDEIKNASLYFGMGKGIERALRYLKETDFSKMEPGRYELDGSNIYAMVNCYQTKREEESSWEAHRKYIDVQFIVEGAERMGYANLNKMKVSQEYNSENDFLILKGEGNFFTVPERTFVIFGPEDVHMPNLAIGKPQQVKKIVVKIKTLPL